VRERVVVIPVISILALLAMVAEHSEVRGKPSGIEPGAQEVTRI
jgi:hypothetical protein